MIQLKSFGGTLSETTSKYISEKFTNEVTENIDLRDMCIKVQEEILLVQNESSSQYLKVENDMEILGEQINQSDQILGELEEMLEDFQVNLSDMKSEMKELSISTSQMSTSLTNRTDFKKELSSFLDVITIDPALKYDIESNKVTPQYAKNCEILLRKIQFVKEGQLQDSKSFQQVRPQLTKLLDIASIKIQKYLQQRFKELSKNPIHFKDIQQDLLTYKIFPAFLKHNKLDNYVSTCQNYSYYMQRVHFGNFKKYAGFINKSYLPVYSQYDLIFTNNPSNMKSNIPTKARKMLSLPIQQDLPLFHLHGREKIIEIIHSNPKRAENKFFLEQAFRTINKFLINGVLTEYMFVQEFYNFNKQQQKIIFSDIFKESFEYLRNILQTQLNKSYDCYAVLLIMLINKKNKEFVNSQGNCKVMDFYFNSVNQLIWPRFETLFDLQLKSIANMNLKYYLYLEKEQGQNKLLSRYTHFSTSLYKINFLAGGNHMLNVRLHCLRDSMMKLLLVVSRQKGDTSAQSLYLVQQLDFIVSEFENQSVNEEDQIFFEKELKQYIDRFTDLAIEISFGGLIDFVQKYINEEKSGDNLLPIIERIHREFQPNWENIIKKYKFECQELLKGTLSYKAVMKKFLQTLLRNYNAFYQYVAKNHSGFGGKLIPVQDVMKSIQTQISSLN